MIAERLSARPENLGRMTALACGAAGGGVTSGMMECVAAWRMQLGEGEERLDEWVIALAAGLPAEAQQAVRGALQRAVAEQLPVLRRIGVLE